MTESLRSQTKPCRPRAIYARHVNCLLFALVIFTFSPLGSWAPRMEKSNSLAAGLKFKGRGGESAQQHSMRGAWIMTFCLRSGAARLARLRARAEFIIYALMRNPQCWFTERIVHEIARCGPYFLWFGSIKFMIGVHFCKRSFKAKYRHS